MACKLATPNKHSVSKDRTAGKLEIKNTKLEKPLNNKTRHRKAPGLLLTKAIT
jgi:hypothetical protein